VKEAFAALESAGYTIASGYTAVLDPQRTKFVYRDELWTGADLIGLGVASFSHAAGVHYQNLTEIDAYLAAIHARERPTKRAFRTSPEELMIREFILQMKLGRVQLGYFVEKFHVKLADRFATQFGHLAAEGFLTVSDTTVQLTRDGLLCVDTLLHEFFLAHHRTSKIV
jgi:oxygen-independent coproporphyrinogen-3 oxidase